MGRVVVMLVFAALFSLSTGASPSALVNDAGAAAQDRQDSRVIITPGGKSFQILTGASAKRHLDNLKTRRPKAIEAASERLRDRGFRPTDRVVVIRAVRDVARSRGNGPFFPAQTVQTDEGEVVFWSWDDGDDGTWEGSFWAQRYADGAEAVYDGQVDVATSDMYVRWEELVWERPGTFDPYYDARGARRPASPYLLTAARREASPYHLVRRFYPYRDWVGCVVGGCAAGAGGCVLSGPLYIECLVLSCAGVKVGCTVDFIIRNL